MTKRSLGTVALSQALLAVLGSACGSTPASPVDSSMADAQRGTKDNPARDCAELHAAGMRSDAYWLRDADGRSPAFQVYCEQDLNGGGWAMVENSVRRDDGTTAAFWQFKYADRLKQLGTPAADQNYYNGPLYLIGKDYMDVFVDLQDTSMIAATMTVAGFNPATMQFTTPTLTTGNPDVFTNQFAGGWSAQDYDGDPYAPASGSQNCSVIYGNIAQHYNQCWSYNLGVDADAPFLDGGVGPHVSNAVLTALGLALQPDAGGYSQVKRIARFTRW